MMATWTVLLLAAVGCASGCDGDREVICAEPEWTLGMEPLGALLVRAAPDGSLGARRATHHNSSAMSVDVVFQGEGIVTADELGYVTDDLSENRNGRRSSRLGGGD